MPTSLRAVSVAARLDGQFMLVAVALGIDPVHFGIVMIVALDIGFITPPFGLNLFAVCTLADLPLQRIITPTLAFIGVVILCLIAITLLPVISFAGA